MSGKREYDIGLVVPLKEEFGYVTEIAAVKGRHAYDGTFFYELNFAGGSTIACIVGEMGPLPASHATNRLLSFANVKLVVLLGLAGALDKELLLGDVVVADDVNEFLAKSKAVEAGEGYVFKFSGRHTRADYSLREAVNHFDVSGGNSLAKWHRCTAEDFNSLDSEAKHSLCNSPPRLHVGSIASGDVVGAADAFAKELLRLDRKFLALDMEAAGVVRAASDRLNPVRFLVVRGISDFADERKSQLDAQGKGVWRRLCLRNATFLVDSLLEWDDFRSCIGLAASDAAANERRFDPARILEGVRERTGGAWLVGVLLGLHSQAPLVLEDCQVTAVDIAAARVSDQHVNEMMNIIEQLQSAMKEGDITCDALCVRLGEAIDAFRARLNPAASEMLTQFDEVIVAVLTPGEEAESDRLSHMLDAIAAMIDEQRLEEAERMLAALDERNARVREMLADVRFLKGLHEQVIQLLRPCEPEALGRRELEHFVVSCYECSQQEHARLLLQVHADRFDDAAGQVFRRHLYSRYAGAAPGSKEQG